MMRPPQTTEAAAVDRSAAPERLKRVKRTPELEIALGARIRAARVAAKMSQTALGAAVGISFQQMQKYEKGSDRVAVSTLQGIAGALGVHPGSFFDDDAPVMQSRSVADVRDALKIGQRLQRVRDPTIVRRLLALADLLAEGDDEEPSAIDDEAT